MDILYLMIICSLTLAAVFLVIFIIGAKSGQFEDDESPAVRMLLENEIIKENPEDEEKQNSDLEIKEKK